MIRFLREHIWAHLPEKVTLKQRLWAVGLWCVVLPLVFWTVHWFRRDGDDGSGFPWAIVGGIFGVLAVSLILPVVGEKTYLGVLGVFSVVGFIIGNILLILTFYLLITPLGRVLKLTGKSSFDTHFNEEDSPPHWTKHKRNVDRRRFYRMS